MLPCTCLLLQKQKRAGKSDCQRTCEEADALNSDPGRMTAAVFTRERYPGRDQFAQQTAGRPRRPRHRIKTVGSLPVASSTAACLVLTTPLPNHVLAGPGPTLSFLISATLSGGLGLSIAWRAGFSLGLVPFFAPFHMGQCPGRLGVVCLACWVSWALIRPRQHFPQRRGRSRQEETGGGNWSRGAFGNAVRTPWGTHSTERNASARPSCRCVFNRKGPGCGALAGGRAQPCIRRVGVKARFLLSRSSRARGRVRRGVLCGAEEAVQATQMRWVVMAMCASERLFFPDGPVRAPCRCRGELKLTGRAGGRDTA